MGGDVRVAMLWQVPAGAAGGIQYRILVWTSRVDLYGLIPIVSLNHAATRAHDACHESAESV